MFYHGGEYFVLLAFLALVFFITACLFFISYTFILRDVYVEKISVYECGFDPFEDTREKFDIHYYLTAIMFIVFDLEFIYIFPWFYTTLPSYFNFYVFIIFFLILFLGLAYELQVGALGWTQIEAKVRKRTEREKFKAPKEWEFIAERRRKRNRAFLMAKRPVDADTQKRFRDFFDELEKKGLLFKSRQKKDSVFVMKPIFKRMPENAHWDLYSFFFVRFIRRCLRLNLIWLNDGEIVLYVSPENLDIALNFLSKSSLCHFNVLSDLFCVDYPRKPNRFELNYVLLSPLFNSRLRLKVLVPTNLGIRSITRIFSNANWFEREIWDMYGVFFFDHPDLRRILTDYGFSGYPLRKDYPLSGFLELRYHEGLKRIVAEPLEFSQKYRYFEFRNPWNN